MYTAWEIPLQSQAIYIQGTYPVVIPPFFYLNFNLVIYQGIVFLLNLVLQESIVPQELRE